MQAYHDRSSGPSKNSNMQATTAMTSLHELYLNTVCFVPLAERCTRQAQQCSSGQEEDFQVTVSYEDAGLQKEWQEVVHVQQA